MSVPSAWHAFTYCFLDHYLRLLGQGAGQVLRGQLGGPWGCRLPLGFPRWGREGGVAGEEKGSEGTNDLVNQQRVKTNQCILVQNGIFIKHFGEKYQ